MVDNSPICFVADIPRVRECDVSSMFNIMWLIEISTRTRIYSD